jgi:CoA:oxalate CoA-transferase
MGIDSTEPRASRPLDGITVLDLTIALSGPFATLLLAGLGARVIKVENPAGGDMSRNNAPYLGASGVKLVRDREDDISISAINRLRNKLGVTLNLKHPRAGTVLADLVRQSDIVMENFSRGVLERLGFGYDFVRNANPQAVFCSITGFGSDGEEGSTKGLDTIIQALSGVMYASGDPDDGPVRCGLQIADLSVALFGAIGVLAALHHARRTGAGQHVDVSMLGALTSLVAGEAYDAQELCGIPLRTGRTIPRLAPFGIYPASDGYVAICAPTEGFAQYLFQAMERADFAADERFKTRDLRVKNVKALDALIEGWTRSKTMAEIISKLDAAGVPVAEVRDPKQAVHDPRVTARQETVPLAHPKYGVVGNVCGSGLPIKFSESDAEFDQPPPGLGEHNQAVYGGILGYSAGQIEEMRVAGLI